MVGGESQPGPDPGIQRGQKEGGTRMAALLQSAIYLGINLVLICLLLVPLLVMAAVCALYFLWEVIQGVGRRCCIL